MKRLRKASMALPLLVLLAGATAPFLVDSEGDVGEEGEAVASKLISGRTASEWADLAEQAAARGSFNKALSSIKTAERVEPGIQYSSELADIRRARWRAREIAADRRRLLGGAVEELVIADDGTVLSGARKAVVLPGESLWTLAGSLRAAERGVLASEIEDDSEVYSMWDALTELNGVRELEVGEQVLVPISRTEREDMTAANRFQLSVLSEAEDLLAGGRLDEAGRLRDEIDRDFVLSGDRYRALDVALEEAFRDRKARAMRDESLAAAASHEFARAESLAAVAVELGWSDSLRVELAELSRAREQQLMEDARLALERIRELPRVTQHGRRLELLRGAESAVREAEALSEGAQYAGALELIDALVADEARFSVAPDGAVVAVKPSGTSYTELARDVIEWMLERELVSSGHQFPMSSLKTPDELAWAAFLAGAASQSRSEGQDFASVLASDSYELTLRFPDPADYFGD